VDSIERLLARKNVAGFLILLFLLLGSSRMSQAQENRSSWTITKIADIDTDLPNWPPGGNKEYSEPSIDNDVVTFKCSVGGGGWPYYCIYTSSLDGNFTIQLDNTTPIPGTTDQYFSGVGGLSLSDGVLAFVGTDPYPSYRGLYKKSVTSSDIAIVVNPETEIPDGIGTFQTASLEIPSINGNTIAFRGFGISEIPQEGIYAEVNDNLIAVADLNTEIPNHVDLSFGDFDMHPSSGGDYVVFVGYDEEYVARGIYRYSIDTDLIEVIADESTDFPVGTEKFANFDRPVIDGGNCAFRGFEEITSRRGVFTYLDGELDVVAMQGDSVPDAFQRYIDDFGLISIDGRDVAFLATQGGSYGYKSILVKTGGVLTKVIDSDEYLDGKGIFAFEISRQALSDDRVVFLVQFADYTWGVYLATRNPSDAPSAEVSANSLMVRPSWPNPFRENTTLLYWLPESSEVLVTIHDGTGRQVAAPFRGWSESGRHTVTWRGTDTHDRPVPSGVYLTRIETGDGVRVGRVVVTR
jgi:hypothetical protein